MLNVRGVQRVPQPDRARHARRSPRSPTWYQIELSREGGLDVVTLKAEINPDVDFEIAAIGALQKRIQGALKAALSVGIAVKIVEPNSIPRSEGKAKRLIDLREGSN